jgi:hypothetical protein
MRVTGLQDIYNIFMPMARTEGEVGGTRWTMVRKFLGITVRRWVEYTVAILVGNAIYYFFFGDSSATGPATSGISFGLG